MPITSMVTSMSFIDVLLADLSRFGNMNTVKQVSRSDLAALLSGKGSLAAGHAVNIAASKITKNVGSTDLRKLVDTLNGKKLSKFSNNQLDGVVAEINYLTKSETVVSKVAKGFASIYETIKLKFKYQPGAKSVLRNGLEVDPNVWAETILHYVRLNGSADTKRCVRTPEDVLLYLRLEGGLDIRNNTVKVDLVNSYNYCGPMQMGPAAWTEGPAQFSPYKSWKNDAIGSADRKSMASATRAFAKGGPGDLTVVGPGVVEFWDACWSQFNSHANKNAIGRRLAQYVPRSVEMMYAMHNAGAYGAFKRLLLQRVSPISNNQSSEAVAVGKVVKRQFEANMA